MNLSYFQQTTTGENRYERWKDIPVPVAPGEQPPRLLFKPIPTRLELFADWKSCINHDMAKLLLDHLEQGTDVNAEKGYLTLFMRHLTNPALVDLDRMAIRLGQKYVKGWDGITDDAGKVVPFKLTTFLSTVLPSVAQWVIETVSMLSGDNDILTTAEKKI
jgi:hypothetical protein